MARSPRFQSVVTLGALGLALAGCNIFVNVPKPLRGDVSVDLSNRLDADICDFTMTPRGYQGPPMHSWLRTANLGPGSGRTFKIKPGDYRVVVGGCQHQYLGVAYIHLVAPTNLLVGFPGDTMAAAYPNTLVPVAGRVGRYVAPVYYAAPANNGGGEAAAPAEAESSGDSSSDSSSESSSDSSSESSSDSSSESSSESSQSAAPAPAAPSDCKPLGSVVNSSTECCSNATKLSPDHTQNICCDHSTDTYCS